MNAFLELRRLGSLGPHGAEMLYDVVETVARRGNFPPPKGGQWTAEALMETAHDYLADDAYPRGLAALYLRATDDDSMRNLMLAHVRNWMRSKSRRTERGVMLERVRRAARSDERFIEADTAAGPTLGLRGQARADPWSGRLAELHVAAAKVPVTVVRWRSDRRRDPEADDASFRNVLAATLEAAGAPLLFRDVIDVFAHKFSLYAAPMGVELTDDPADWSPTPEAATMIGATVDDIWAQLSAEERRTLAAYGPVRDMATQLGKGKSRAHVLKQRLDALLQRLLRDSPDPEAVVEALTERARRWGHQVDEASR